MKHPANYYIIVFSITLFLLIAMNWSSLRITLIMLMTLKRGILSQNCFWWSINDLLADSTGVEIYQTLKGEGRFVRLNLAGRSIHLLTDMRDVKQLLDHSPKPFGPGKIKENFFKTFMPANVGISKGAEWEYRRSYNDRVLETDRFHSLNGVFREYIQTALFTMKPTDFESFTDLTRRLTSKIIFGTYDYNPLIYKVFKQADSVLSALFGTNTVNANDLAEYRHYLEHELQHPKPNTLMGLGHRFHAMLPIQEVIDQIPHWIFPIAGLFSVHLPRLLVLLANHPDELRRVQLDFESGTIGYARNCILELFRLNNAVNSTFRTLTEPFQFPDSEHEFPAGTEFVFFNNPILRDLFENPHQYQPMRWNSSDEHSYMALMFNQGNQRCPGKELTISLLTMGLEAFLKMHNYQIKTNIQLNPAKIPYILNPCTIRFES